MGLLSCYQVSGKQNSVHRANGNRPRSGKAVNHHESQAEIPKKKRLWVVISPLVYGTVYLINILMNGAEGNDVYGFTLWGYPVAAVIFAAICAMTYLAGVLLAKANEKVRRLKDAQKA